MNLAILGGEKSVTRPFTSWPVYDEREVRAVADIIESGDWWRMSFGEGTGDGEPGDGEKSRVALFQDEFAAYQGAKYGLCCANGTASLELILKSLGIGPGDEVIVPSYTFVSTASAVLQVNAAPVFADIDPETYNLDPNSVLEAITPRTRAVIAVHFFGQPADMDALAAIAKKHSLYLIEDAAHAHGSEWGGRRVGALGDAGSFSFQASKNMTAGEGGAILTNDLELARGCDSRLWLGRKVQRPWYEFHTLGWNYRMTEFQGALLSVQLSRLDEQIERRQKNVDYFYSRLNELGAYRPIKRLEMTTRHSNHIIGMRYDKSAYGVEKQRLRSALIAEGVAATVDYAFPLYKNPMFLNKDFGKGFFDLAIASGAAPIDYAEFEKTNPVAERACSDEALWLEHRMFLGSEQDVDAIIGALKKIEANISALR